MNIDSLLAVSPIDGRYSNKCSELQEIFSEFGLIKRRVLVECTWLKALAADPKIRECKLTAAQAKAVDKVAAEFSLADAQRVKDIEKTTNHDVKAVEYFLKEKLSAAFNLQTSNVKRQTSNILEFIHFGCTSEDINNMSHALMLRDGQKVLRGAMDEMTAKVVEMAKAYAKVPMLAHTHGQPASPTTVGKELAVVSQRLKRQAGEIDRLVMPAKMNGAVGNFNAHLSAYPDVDWEKLSGKVIKTLGLRQNRLTTQIESHDGIAELFDAIQRWNSVLLDFDRDVWMYVSMGYFKQRTVKGEIGSSTMPHKVNPIDFENSEGNLGLANAILNHLAGKLPVSRLQRDLTDSTVLRNVGVPLAHMMIALHSTLKGLHKLLLNEAAISRDLDNMWNVVAEAIQTILRREGYEKPYETLKALTRTNSKVDAESIASFIDTLKVSDAVKEELKAITPHNYTGF